MDEVKFSVKVTGMDLFRFLMQHSYRGVSLVINALITGGALVFMFLGLGTDPLQKTIALLVLAMLFPVIYPMQLLLKAFRQAKNPVFRAPLTYTVNDAGIEMSQGEQKEAFQWEDVFQIRETKRLILVYTGRVYACIWPKQALGGNEAQVKKLFEAHLDKAVYRPKGGMQAGVKKTG